MRRDSTLRELRVERKSRKKQLETKGFALSVVEMREVAKQSVQTNELLERVAGVKIRQDGGLGSRTSYNINGLSGNAVKVFIDGVPASHYGSTFSLGSIPPALIERVEIYKGVLPGYLADDALGGAINVVLKEHRRSSLSTSYSLGSFGTHQWNMLGNLRLKSGFTLEGAAFYNFSRNDYPVWGKDVYLKNDQGQISYPDAPLRRFHDAYRSTGAKLGVGYTQRAWADRLMLTALTSSDYKEVQHGSTMESVYGDRHTRRRTFVLGLSYAKRELLPRLSLQLDASVSALRRQVIDTVGIMYDWAGPIRSGSDYVRYSSGAEVGNRPTLGINDEYTTMIRSQLSYRLGGGATLYANYIFNDFRRKSSDELQTPLIQAFVDTRDLRKSVLALTWEQIALSGRLRTNAFYKHYFQRAISHEPRLEAGVMTQTNTERSIDHSGYGLTASYALAPKWQVMLSGEYALRLPTANEMFGNISENLLPPSPELSPERSLNLNLGTSYAFSLGQLHHFGLNATLYYRGVKGMIREAVQAGSFTYTRFENLENVLSHGIDCELTYDYDTRLHFRFALSRFATLFDTEYDAMGNRYQYYGMQIRNEPSFKFSTQLSYDLRQLFARGDKAQLHASLNYVEGFLRNWANVGSANLARIPTQCVLDLGASYTFGGGRLTLSADAKNVFNRQAFDNFGLQKSGRAFYAKVSYNIF